MKTKKSVNPAPLALLFAIPLGCSIWVASNNIAIGASLAVVIIGVYISIIRGDWINKDDKNS